MPLRCDSVGFLKPISEDESSTLSAPSGRLKLTGKDLTISRLSSAPKISRRGVAGNSTKVDGWTSKSLLRFKDFVQSIEQRNFLDGDVSAMKGANKQVISSQADSLIKISRIWADFFPANTSNQPI